MLKQLEEDINYWMDGVELDLYATFFFFSDYASLGCAALFALGFQSLSPFFVHI